MLKKILPVLLVTILILILVIIKVYPGLHQKLVNNQKKESQNIEKSIENIKHRDIAKEDQYPFNTKSEEKLTKKYSDKFNIVKKMYYSWDYIKNVHAIYEMNFGDDNNIAHVEFNVDFTSNKNRAIHKKKNNGKTIETINLLLKNNNAVRQKPKQNIFTSEEVTDDRDMNHYIGLFNRFITNSEWQTLIYNNYQDWDYKEGEEFGVKVYEIEGEISSEKSESLTGPFTMVVAKETGILLDLKCYGSENKVIQSITVQDIQINQGISDDVFKLDVSGNKKVSNKAFNTSGIENYEEKTGGVDTSDD